MTKFLSRAGGRVRRVQRGPAGAGVMEAERLRDLERDVREIVDVIGNSSISHLQHRMRAIAARLAEPRGEAAAPGPYSTVHTPDLAERVEMARAFVGANSPSPPAPTDEPSAPPMLTSKTVKSWQCDPAVSTAIKPDAIGRTVSATYQPPSISEQTPLATVEEIGTDIERRLANLFMTNFFDRPDWFNKSLAKLATSIVCEQLRSQRAPAPDPRAVELAKRIPADRAKWSVSQILAWALDAAAYVRRAAGERGA